MNISRFFEAFATPVGPVTVVVDDEGALTDLYLSDVAGKVSARASHTYDPARTRDARQQLEEYARGERREFTLRLAPKGTEFQKRVWAELLKIPYGETRSYGEIAAAIGNPSACRAVGRANGTNPIGIVVPCHRVIGSSGSLTGYGGGLPMKKRLLKLEGSAVPTLFDGD